MKPLKLTEWSILALQYFVCESQINTNRCPFGHCYGIMFANAERAKLEKLHGLNSTSWSMQTILQNGILSGVVG